MPYHVYEIQLEAPEGIEMRSNKLLEIKEFNKIKLDHKPIDITFFQHNSDDVGRFEEDKELKRSNDFI